MSEQRKALIGFHSIFGDDIANLFKGRGYAVIQERSLEGMLSQMGLSLSSSPEAVPTVSFDWYVMDVNLGESAGNTCEQAARIYGHVKKDVTANKAVFMSFTANTYAQKLAEKEGIPVINKLDINANLDFYDTIKKI